MTGDALCLPRLPRIRISGPLEADVVHATGRRLADGRVTIVDHGGGALRGGEAKRPAESKTIKCSTSEAEFEGMETTHALPTSAAVLDGPHAQPRGYIYWYRNAREWRRPVFWSVRYALEATRKFA